VVNSHSGEVTEATIFVAVLGASNYTYARGHLDAESPRLDGAHVRTFVALGGVPRDRGPRQLKAAVTVPTANEPDSIAPSPTSPTTLASPCSQREQPSHGIGQGRSGCPSGGTLDSGPAAAPHLLLTAEVNAAISPLLLALNATPSRSCLFHASSCCGARPPGAQPLPVQPYEYAEWKQVSCQYRLPRGSRRPLLLGALRAGQTAARCTPEYSTSWKCSRRGNAWPATSAPPQGAPQYRRGAYAHRAQRYVEWTPQRLIHWARPAGPATARVVETILPRGASQQGFRSCLGIMRLGKRYSTERLERPVGGHSRSGPVPTKVSNRSSKTGSTAARYLAAARPDVSPLSPEYPWPPYYYDEEQGDANAYASHIGTNYKLRLTGMLHGHRRADTRCPTWLPSASRSASGSWSTASFTERETVD